MDVPTLLCVFVTVTLYHRSSFH